MRVVSVRNVHGALPRGLQMLEEEGIPRDSRYGPVLHFPTPVTTVYAQPQERVVHWPQRDYNIAFVLYEAMWMLQGRNDLAPLLRYVRTFGEFSDDGHILYGAYGYRWRRWGVSPGFDPTEQMDQLEPIIERLKENADDRRCVLQMWDPQRDLDLDSKDVPCNDTVTFQRGARGELNMVVFCRSNDVLWGAYYANAFHFSFLQEYMAQRIGCPLGTYSQVSVNYHGYLKTLEEVRDLPRPSPYHIRQPCPYESGEVYAPALAGNLDSLINQLVEEADSGIFGRPYREEWARAAQAVLWAHDLWRRVPGEDRFKAARAVLYSTEVSAGCDWIASMRRWLDRREEKWLAKSANA